jgi:hypothetical protein
LVLEGSSLRVDLVRARNGEHFEVEVVNEGIVAVRVPVVG